MKRSSRCCTVSLSPLTPHFTQSRTAIKSSQWPPTLRGAPFHISRFEMLQRITSFYHTSTWTASLLYKTGSAEQTFDVDADLNQKKTKMLVFPPTADMCWCVTPTPIPWITWLITPEPAHHAVTTRPSSRPLYSPCERKPDRWHMALRHSICCADGDTRVPVWERTSHSETHQRTCDYGSRNTGGWKGVTEESPKAAVQTLVTTQSHHGDRWSPDTSDVSWLCWW